MDSRLWTVAAGVGVLTVVALVCDLRWRRIPNWLTVSSALTALGVHAAFDGWSGLGFALAGFAVGFGALFVLWLIGGGGGGDVKLMGAMGAWLGAAAVSIVFVGTALLALVFVMAVVVWQAIGKAGAPALAGARGGSGVTAGLGGVRAAARADKSLLAGSKVGSGPVHAARRLIPFAVLAAIAAWSWLGLKLLVAWGQQ